MQKAVIKVKTPEAMKQFLVKYLRDQALGYSSAARIAMRVTVKKEAQVKADCLHGIANLVEQIKIDTGE